MRVGLGTGALFFTGATLKALLFGEADGRTRALAKLLGGRDLALGIATLAARGDERALAKLTSVAVLLDTADALAMGIAARDQEVRPAAIGGVASGAGAAAAGLWASRRLAR